MIDQDRTKEQLIGELTSLRQQVAELKQKLSEQEWSDEVLRESETRFRALVETLPHAVSYIHGLDENGDLLYVSPQVEKLVGYTACELERKPGGWMSCIHADDREWVGLEFRRCLEPGEQFVSEYRAISKDGETVWLHDVAEVVRDSKGAWNAVLGIAFDISRHKHVEEALRKSEEKYRELVENANSIILRMDKAGNVTFFNEFAQRFFGYSEKEILGKNVVGTIVPEVESTGRELRALIEDIGIHPDRHITGMNENMCRSGERVWVAWTNKAIWDDQGRVNEILCIGNDITERRRAEEELQKLASVVKYSSELINLATLDGKMIFLNDAGARALGIEPEEVEKTHLMQVLPDHLQEVVQNEILPTLMKQGTWEGDLQGRNLKTGTLTDLHTMAFTIADPISGAPLYLVNLSRDISERKRAEEALQESKQQLADIIDFLPDATFVIDKEGKVLAWNRASEKLTGLQKEDILGRNKDAIATELYGQPRPMLVDLVLDPALDLADAYDHLEQRGNTLFAETYAPGLNEGEGGYLWANASPLSDRQGKVNGAIESIRDITGRKEMESALREREQELEAKSVDLLEINTALKVLLKRREEDEKEFGANVLSNMKELVLPYLEKLRNSHLGELQKTYLSILESHLQEIGAPFLRKLSGEFRNLSPMERQIASLIREGKRNKEISEILGVSVNTILTHRYHLRTKLGLKNKDINLVSYLKSINV